MRKFLVTMLAVVALSVVATSAYALPDPGFIPQLLPDPGF